MNNEGTSGINQPISRRTAIRGAALGGAGLAAAALIGCSSDDDAGFSSDGLTGGELIVGVGNDLNPKGVPYRLQASTTGMVVRHAFGTLLQYDEELKAEPYLAESFTLADDAMSCEIKLRDGITFHDGRKFTAEDVKWNLIKVTEPEQRSQLGQIAKGVENIIVADERSLRLEFNRPMANFSDLLVISPMADPDTFDQIETGMFNGTGPYRLTEWNPKESVKMERFENFVMDTPVIDSITFLQFQDNQAQGIALEAGDVHYIHEQVSPEDYERWAAGDQIKTRAAIERGSGWYFGLNCAIPPMDDVRVRKAMNLAMNRDRFLNEVLLIGRKMTTPWPTFSPAFDKEIDSQVTFDLDAAKALLAEAGYPDGLPEPITCTLLPTRSAQIRCGEIWQADLAKIGINLEFKQTEYAEMIGMLSSGTFDQAWVGFGYGFAQFQPATTVQVAFPLRYPNTSNYEAQEWIDVVEEIKNASGGGDELGEIYDRYTQAFVDGHFVLPFSPRTALNARAGNLEDYLNVYGTPFFERFGFTS
jgi:peptide/nickel transport system substrate-binding protein